MDGTILLVGTRKGLWIGRSDEERRGVGVHRPALRHGGGLLLHGRHPRDRPRLLAGASSSWLGPQVRRSDDLGATWQETPDGAIRFPEDTGASVERVWQLDAGRRATASSTPAPSRARSCAPTDGGETFALERALWDHPHRPQWGAGFGGQAFHTILPHPDRPAVGDRRALDRRGLPDHRRRRLVGSRATRASGRSSCPRASSTPSSASACTRSPGTRPRRERLFLQNHGGVYRSDDEGGSWTSIADGLPADFGFPIVVHPHEPDTVFVFPLNGGDGRYPPEGKARVWRSRDAGETWEAAGRGAARHVLRRRHARRDVRRRPRAQRALRRRAQRRGLGLARRGRDLDRGRRQPARRDGGPGGRDLTEAPSRGGQAATSGRRSAWTLPVTQVWSAPHQQV